MSDIEEYMEHAPDCNSRRLHTTYNGDKAAAHFGKCDCGYDEAAAELRARIAALEAVLLAAGEVMSELKADIAGWRKHADGDYCRAYNKERGQALSDAANMIERDIAALAAALDAAKDGDK